MTKIKTMEVFKQFAFATVFFVTCISIHWNFVGSKNHNVVYQQQNQIKHQMQQKVQIKVLDEALAMNESNKTAKL